ncbi:hypothetical protein Tco_0278058 [Tanacetum coccineum]
MLPSQSAISLWKQMAYLMELVGQAIQKKKKKKRIAEEHAAKDRSWKIPQRKSDEVIKSSVEDLVPIPSESEGYVNSDDDNSSSDDDSPYDENIDYVDASPLDVEIVSLEVVEIFHPEVGRIDDDILT